MCIDLLIIMMLGVLVLAIINIIKKNEPPKRLPDTVIKTYKIDNNGNKKLTGQKNIYKSKGNQ